MTRLYFTYHQEAILRYVVSSWRNIFKRMMADPLHYLMQYYQREKSESSFSADKRALGWKVWQRLDDRINTAISYAMLHNLFRLDYG